MGCAKNCVKFSFLIFNVLILCAGISILVVGVLLHLNVIDYIIPISQGDNLLEYSSLILLTIGSMVTVVSLFGCCGALKDYVPLLTAYVIVLLTLFVIQICLGVYVLFEINCETELERKLGSYLQRTFASYSNDTVAQERMDRLQIQLECCGVNGTADWSSQNGALPSSCCLNSVDSCTAQTTGVFTVGCLRRVMETFIRGVTITYIIAFCLAAAEVIGIIFGSILINSIKNGLRRDRYSRYRPR